MRICILIVSFTVLFLQTYSIVGSQEASFGDIEAEFREDPCQFVWKGSDVSIPLLPLPEGLHNVPLSWGNERLPVEFYVDGNMPEEFIKPIYETASEWNAKIGFEIIRINGIYDDVDREQRYIDQKNVIYWINNSSLFVRDGQQYTFSLTHVQPQIDIFSKLSYLPINEADIFMNGNIFYDEKLLKYNQEIIPILFSDHIPIPLNDQASFEVADAIHILQNMNDVEFQEAVIRLLEFQRQHNVNILGLSDEGFEDLREPDKYNQFVTQFESFSGEQLDGFRPVLSSLIEQAFTLFHFDFFKDREKNIIYFKNVLKHEMGHTLGLANLYRDDVDITDQTQMPLMWYTIEEGLNSDGSTSYFDNTTLEVDNYALHALSCNYDLETLRGQAQQP